MNHVAEDAAVPVDLFEVDLLDEIEAQFVAYDLTCDQDDGRPITIGLEYAVDEMQTAGAATACDCRQAIRYLRLRPRSKPLRVSSTPTRFRFFRASGRSG